MIYSKSDKFNFYWIIKSCILLFVVLTWYSCKEDKPNYATPEEESYYQDYESPTYKWGMIDPLGNLVIDALGLVKLTHTHTTFLLPLLDTTMTLLVL